MIKVQNLTKAFGTKLAVNGVSFSVERGEVLGFLGPNGAGKSTSMRMITGFIPPTSGSVTVGGHDIVENPIPAKRLMGYLPENAPSYHDMTVHGFLAFAAELRGLQGDARKRAVNRAVEMCFLEGVLHQSIETLSKGFRHRTCFAQSIIHDPDVLILDEPTDGLDPNQKHEIRTLIRRMGEKKAIIFSTHILEEVESVCSRAIIIDRGRVVANGTPSELKLRSELAGAITFKVVGVSAQDLKDKTSQINGVRKTLVVKDDPSVSTVRIYPSSKPETEALAQSLGQLALREKWVVQDLHIEEGRLDEVFRTITLPETGQEGRK
ncbi:MAG: ATP-binding cassette domain-containing protein [Pedosphaera sp.]|nr:ATP-binding cassette domain-containing protein [Pedosphaera sp.]